MNNENIKMNRETFKLSAAPVAKTDKNSCCQNKKAAPPGKQVS